MSNTSSSPAQSSLSLTVQDGKITASSREVARVFGKNHRDVLRAIENLDCSKEFTLRNFAHGSYTLPRTGSQKHPCCEMTRDGFTFLAMGFTGKKAAQWKEAYINAFNEMEEKLRKQKASRFDFGLKRFLGSFNEKGQFSLKEIPQNSHIVSMQELPERIADPNNFIGDRETERELMMEIALAAIARGALGATAASRMISIGKRVSLGPAALKTTI